jgi:hypothetical protein
MATGLKEDELDPMSAELAETLEFDRVNGKTPVNPSADDQALPDTAPVSAALSTTVVSVDA